MSPVELRDGRRAVVRLLLDSDRPAYAAAVAALSPASRYERFISARPELDERELDFLTRVDGSDHVAFVAASTDGATGLGAARYVRLAHDATTADVAFAVADDWHAVGLGGALLDAVIAHATAAGVTTLVATTLSTNAGALALLRSGGFAIARRTGATTDLRRAASPGAHR